MAVYKMSELVGTSPDGFEAAIREAILRASKNIRNINWFEVREQRGLVKDGQVVEFQVKVQIGFRVED